MANKFLTVAIPTTNSTVVRVRKADKLATTREVQMHDATALARAIAGGKRREDFLANGEIGFRKKTHMWTLTK